MNDLPCTPDTVLKGVDFCLVTHLHFDHFSPDYLPKDLRIIAQNENDAESIRSMGFGNVESFASEEIQISGITISKTKAIHGENEAVVKKMGTVCGYVFRASEEKTLYLAADTVYCDEVERTIERFRPEVIILNCCGATVPLGRLIMGADDAKKICRKAPEAVIIATHLDSVNHALYTSEDIKNYMGLTYHPLSFQILRMKALNMSIFPIRQTRRFLFPAAFCILIPQYELENFCMLYEAYKKLHGNSFIDKVAEDVKEWKVVK